MSENDKIHRIANIQLDFSPLDTLVIILTIASIAVYDNKNM